MINLYTIKWEQSEDEKEPPRYASNLQPKRFVIYLHRDEINMVRKCKDTIAWIDTKDIRGSFSVMVSN